MTHSRRHSVVISSGKVKQLTGSAICHKDLDYNQQAFSSECVPKNNVLISQPKHMRRFF